MKRTAALEEGELVPEQPKEVVAAKQDEMRPARQGCGTSYNVATWCNTDPCGLICAVITWGLILYATYVSIVYLILGWLGWSVAGVLNILGFGFVATMATLSHVRAMMTNPGAVPREAAPVVDDVEAAEEGKMPGDASRRVRKYCRRCNAFKPPRAHHCSICQRCIIKMDHHCPWVNNCVGIGNHKLFLLFVFYIFIMCIYSLVLIVARYTACFNTGEDCGDGSSNLLVVFLVIEAILFGLFTCCMMLDQYTVVSTNTTSIDRLKGEYHAIRQDVNEVFGGRDGRFRADWFVPIPVRFPPCMASDILGYRVEGDDMEEGLMMTERRPSRPSDANGQPSPSVVSRERLDGEWSVERVEIGTGWGADETMIDDDADDTAKLLRTLVASSVSER